MNLFSRKNISLLLCTLTAASLFTACGPEDGSSSQAAVSSSVEASSGTESLPESIGSPSSENSEAESSSPTSSQAPTDDPNWLSSEDATPEQERAILEQLDDLAVSLAAGSGSSPQGGTVGSSGGTYTGSINIKTPSAPGTVVHQGNNSVIDASNVSEGYVMVKHTGSTNRLKVQIKCGSMTYNYDLNNSGAFEVFPLQMGNGSYTVRTMENVSGSSYRELYRADISVTLASSTAPFAYPNQYVNYNASSAAVKKSFDLCVNDKTDLDKLKSIYNFMISNIKYDYDKAKTVKSGYLPNVDTILSSKKGICFDYSALMATMLRAQGVPTKLVVGSAGPEADNHAWNEVYLEGTGWITIKIENTNTGWKLMDPTFGASGSMGSAYTAARVY